jgi:hypothetical protein
MYTVGGTRNDVHASRVSNFKPQTSNFKPETRNSKPEKPYFCGSNLTWWLQNSLKKLIYTGMS